MKRFILAAICLIGFQSAAHFPVIVDAEESRGLISEISFTPLQLGMGFIDCAQLFDGQVPCFAAFGLLGLLQQSAAVSFAPVNMLRYNYFLQSGAVLNVSENNCFFAFSPCNLAHRNYALQTGIFNFSARNFGVQIGLFNIGGMIQIGLYNSEGNFQIGLVNYNPDAWLPWLPFINFSKK